jgi:hypothetical protein
MRVAQYMDFTLDGSRRLLKIYPAPGVGPEMISIFLGGTILAHALTADGQLMLHASAVAIDHEALAVIGPSGGGKSTMAAVLCGAGATLVTDDALRVDVAGSEVVGYPGTATIRLREAAKTLGSSVVGARVGKMVDGRTSVGPQRHAGGPVPLKALVVAEPSRQASELQVERLSGTDRVAALLANRRILGSFVPSRASRLFELTIDIADAVPLYRASIPWGPPFRPDLAEELLAATGFSKGVRHFTTRHLS